MTRTVAIIGGGASGVLTAVHLARSWRAPTPLRVVLYDAAPVPARGLAYGTDDDRHVLNVPAAKMSALADDRHHFVRWLRRHDPHATDDAFRPRADYGRYLGDTLAEHSAAAGLVVRRSQVTDLLRVPDGFIVSHITGTDHAHAVVLALGNPPPAPLSLGDDPLPGRASHVADPWSPGALARVRELAGPGQAVLLVGTGLTAIDVALTLGTAPSGPRVVAVSRHGLLPRRHVLPLPDPWPVEPPTGAGPVWLGELEAFLRLEIERARREGVGWRAVLDGIRPHLSTLWQRMPIDERRRFLGGPVRAWEVHRHRMAPTAARAVQQLMAQGRFAVHTGALTEAKPAGSGWSVRVARGRRDVRIQVAAIVNCTGPSSDTLRCRGPLVGALVRRGLVRPDPLGLGLDTAIGGELIDRHGAPDPALLAIGPLRRGQLWESTAVPEIREQAAGIARCLGGRLATEAAGFDRLVAPPAAILV